MNLVNRARDLLAVALRRSIRRGQTDRADRIRRAQDDLEPPKRIITWPGVAAARDQSRLGGFPDDPGGPNPGAGWCLKFVRLCYGIGPRELDAAAAWKHATKRHAGTPLSDIPRGYPVFWLGGANGHGHVAISAGDGMCWSSDIKRAGFMDRVPLSRIHAQWGLSYVGWTEDLNGQDVDAREVETR